MALVSTKSAQEHSANFSSRQRTIALIVVSLAFIMDLLDSTIVNVAIPTIQSNLHATYATIQWLLAGYSLTFALLLITGGRMGDVYGYKKMFMIGVGGFTIASLLSGVSVSPGMLIGARLLQGSMAALMVPQVISLMQVMYKPEERGAINGLFGAMAGVAASLGPVIGGILIKFNIAGLDWRPIFLINVPVGVVGLLAAQKYLPNGKSTHPLKLDLIGTGIIVVALTLLVFPLIQGRELGWPLWSFIMMLASLPVFYIFGRWQVIKNKRDKSPLIVPELFTKRAFAAGLLVNLVFEGAMLGFFLTFTLVIQIGMGFSAIHSALTGLPIAIGIAVTMATLGEKVIPRLGRKAIMLGGSIMTIGFTTVYLTLHHYGLATHSWQLIPGLLIVGIGMGNVFGSLYGVVLNGVEVKHAGAASGILNAVQQVGGAIGIALIGVVFFGQLNHGATTSFQSVTPQLEKTLTAQQVPISAQTAIVTGTKHCFIDRSEEKDNTVVPPSCKQTANQKTTPAVSSAIAVSAKQANDHNFNRAFGATMIFSASLLVIVFGLAFLLPKKSSTQPLPEF
jgi:EmrB/QacA subfamily drug resistance transporter